MQQTKRVHASLAELTGTLAAAGTVDHQLRNQAGTLTTQTAHGTGYLQQGSMALRRSAQGTGDCGAQLLQHNRAPLMISGGSLKINELPHSANSPGVVLSCDGYPLRNNAEVDLSCAL